MLTPDDMYKRIAAFRDEYKYLLKHTHYFCERDKSHNWMRHDDHHYLSFCMLKLQEHSFSAIWTEVQIMLCANIIYKGMKNADRT
jgi:hypothetical protein